MTHRCGPTWSLEAYLLARSTEGATLFRAIFVLALGLFSGSARADLTDLDSCSKDAMCLLISGAIDDLDAIKVQMRDSTHLGKGRRAGVGVMLDCPGGDIFAAMKIGRHLRAMRAIAWVDSNGRCLSACVLVLAGAVSRQIGDGARVGIHRPYSDSTEPRTFGEQQAKYDEVHRSVRAYLLEMNVPESLFDDMVRVPSSQMQLLSKKALNDYGLSGIDPVEADLRDAAAARDRGLSRVEYLRRKGAAQMECGKSWEVRPEQGYANAVKAWSDCHGRVLGRP